MKVTTTTSNPTLVLEVPTLTAAVRADTSVNLSVTPNEDTRNFTEWDAFCRKVGDTEFTLCGIGYTPEVTEEPASTGSVVSLYSGVAPYEEGETYEFYVLNYGPRPAHLFNSTDSAPSNIVTLTF